MKKERSRFGITLDMLKVVQKEPNFQKYFDYLIEDGLIAKSNDCYMLTSDGIDFMNKLDNIESIIP